MMGTALSALAASDPATKHADWLEFTALCVADRRRSLQDLIQVIRQSGTAAEIGSDEPRFPAGDRGSEISQRVAEAALTELEAREIACGGSYPFRVSAQGISATRTARSSLYTFLLLLSTYGAKAGPKDINAIHLFDEVAARAAANYLNGESYVFAFPRLVAPSNFVEALTDLTGQLGEGRGNRKQPTESKKKDAKLDIVSWRSFLDGRHGKVLAFGQCATGDDWETKLAELQPRTFYSMWFEENPAIEPVRMFFMPFRILEDDWLEVAYSGGIVFDRCRLAHHATLLPAHLRSEIGKWNRELLTKGPSS